MPSDPVIPGRLPKKNQKRLKEAVVGIWPAVTFGVSVCVCTCMCVCVQSVTHETISFQKLMRHFENKSKVLGFYTILIYSTSWGCFEKADVR